MSQQLLSYGLGATSGLLSHAATAAVFIYGGHQVITGTLTVGTLIAFVAYMTRSTGSAVSLLNLYVAYQRAAVSFDRVAELVHADEASAEVPALPLPSPSTVRRGGEIILEDVGLGEAACGRRLLENCSLIIPAGAKVTICGPSGAGKSTLVDALTRFGPLDRGRILLDGTDITTITTGELRRRICVLQPEPVIFGGSILDNVRYGSFEAREGQVLEVTHRVGLGAEVAAERDGRTGPLGNGGKRLSAGQRQRVAIARALLRDPQVLVLDEALAHLDREAARELHALIDRTFAGRTRLVISHAPERVPAADMCLEFHGGRLAPCAQGEPRTHAVSACPPEDPGTPGAGSPGNVRRRGS
jgi:ATP-binding cassette subfamily B protein